MQATQIFVYFPIIEWKMYAVMWKHTIQFIFHWRMWCDSLSFSNSMSMKSSWGCSMKQRFRLKSAYKPNGSSAQSLFHFPWQNLAAGNISTTPPSFPSEKDVSPSHQVAGTYLYTWVKRYKVAQSFLSKEKIRQGLN